MWASSRRDFLRIGSLGALGLPWLWWAARGLGAASKEAGFGRARRCVLLFLTGGPPQLDTFDLKPDAPAEIRGELRPIATRVSGMRFGELCTHLARQAQRLCVVRSVTHTDTVHTSAGYTMLTGVPHGLANSTSAKLIRPTANDHPHFASLVAWARPPRRGTPAFAALPEVIKDDAVNEYPGQGAGFLGNGHGPFLIDAGAGKTGFRVPALGLPDGMSPGRLADRRRLLAGLDRTVSGERDELVRRACDLVRSPGVQRALQLQREPDRVSAAYGPHLFGRGCLLARRLLEAGVPLVSVYWHYEGPADSPVWDTHQNNFRHLRDRLLPPADRAIAALIEDLAARGLLDDTLVLCLGEFGRTPRINKHGGRDHWPHVQSVLLAGAGVRAGSVYGSSDRHGAYPATAPVSPADLVATVLHLLGVSPDVEVRDRTGRPLTACSGAVVKGVLE